MDKLIYTGDQDELVKAAGVLVTFFEDIRGIKSASSNSFSDEMMRAWVPDDRHFGIHLIAMGCGEDYGFNKNGDFWNRSGLEHEDGDYGTHTFVSDGHFFREHNNRDLQHKIGDIKAAAYNKRMQRSELVVHGDKARAEDEYQQAKAGKALSFSMSARVPYDECSCCHKKAKSSKNYCEHAKRHMTKWLPEFSKFAFVYNDRPKFFDISRVKNPADRIAHHIQYLFDEDEMAKAASENGSDFLFSDLQPKLAGVKLPVELQLGCSTPERQALLQKLASAEEYLWHVFDRPDQVSKDQKYVYVKNAATYAFDPYCISDNQVEWMRAQEPDVMWREFVKRGAVLPFLPFYAYVHGCTIKEASEDPTFQLAQTRYLPFAFRKALETEADLTLESLFQTAPREKLAGYDPTSHLADIAAACTLAQPMLNTRILRICSDSPEPCGSGVKSASDNADQAAQAQAVAHAYAIYKVAFVEAMSEHHGRNIIDEPSLLLIAYPTKA